MLVLQPQPLAQPLAHQAQLLAHQMVQMLGLQMPPQADPPAQQQLVPMLPQAQPLAQQAPLLAQQLVQMQRLEQPLAQ